MELELDHSLIVVFAGMVKMVVHTVVVAAVNQGTRIVNYDVEKRERGKMTGGSPDMKLQAHYRHQEEDRHKETDWVSDPKQAQAGAGHSCSSYQDYLAWEVQSALEDSEHSYTHHEEDVIEAFHYCDQEVDKEV